MHASDLNALIEQLADSYINHTDVDPNSVLTPQQQQNRSLANLKEFFKLKTLQDHLNRALPALLVKCQQGLDPREWNKIQQELLEAIEIQEVHMDAQGNPLSLRENLHFSLETVDRFEWAGLQYFEAKQYALASSIFTLLTVLDPFVDKYWLQCGIAHDLNKEYTEALHCFAAASFLNASNPLPNLFACECYRKMFDLESARLELDLAKKILQESQAADPLWHQMVADLGKSISF